MARMDGTETRQVELPQGTVRYHERGSGRPVLFVHGVLVNATLWRKVVPGVADAGYRCIAPDWPMGGHELPMRPDADLSPHGQAKLIADFIEALDLHDVLIVANDTGGAITQFVMTRRPDRISGVVLTPCDCFEYFFPPLFRILPVMARIPGAMWVMAAMLQVRALHRLPIAFGWMSKRPVDRAATDSYFRPIWRDRRIRRDAAALLRGVDNKLTMAAAEELPKFAAPVLLVWAKEDKVFPVKLAHRLAGVLADATVVEVEDSYAFVPEDRPDALVEQIVAFGARLPA
jgi:pimeloyl-ACP methyl ester carboxylesterase